jgi:hypothetical protein
MAKNSRQDELIERLHADGIRKRVATAVTGARGGRKKGEAQARALLERLEDATATLRQEVLGPSRKRSASAKKAADTRKKNADKAKRSAAAKKAAATRARNKKKAKA